MSFEAGQVAYLFLDEGGNFDFSAKGTQYFTMTSVLKFRPFETSGNLNSLRYDLIERGINMEYFHASEDRQAVRDRVFDVICKDLMRFKVDCVIVDKSKTAPSLRPPEKFYAEILGHLLHCVLREMSLEKIAEVIVITDTIPIQKKRKATEKVIKRMLTKLLPTKVPYRLLHHSSKSASGLQIADYFNWAIFRAWERGDQRSLKRIEPVINNRIEYFAVKAKKYYEHATKK
jgi:hypothetical protein